MESLLIFIFTNDLTKVLLVSKSKVYIPRINGICGKVETCDSSSECAALKEIYDETGYTRDDFCVFENLITKNYKSGNVLHIYYAVLSNQKEFQQKRPNLIEWWDVEQVDEKYDIRFSGGGGPQLWVRMCLEKLK